MVHVCSLECVGDSIPICSLKCFFVTVFWGEEKGMNGV